jgi:hypothetical protein
LEPCFIGKDFEESSRFFQSSLLCMHSYNRINECSQALFGNSLKVQLTQYLFFNQAHLGKDAGILHFYVILRPGKSFLGRFG